MSQYIFIAVMRHDQGNSKEEFIGGLLRVSEIGPWEAGQQVSRHTAGAVAENTYPSPPTHTRWGGGRKDRRQDGETGRREGGGES